MFTKKLIALAGCATLLCSYTIPTFAADPFIKKWTYFDGIKTYQLNIKKGPARGYAYHIDYTFLNGSAATDMCNATSGAAIKCITGDILTRNDPTYSITVKTSGHTYVYYDPTHMPAVDYALGSWNATQTGNDGTTSNYNISIMRDSSGLGYNVSTSFHDTRGNSCSWGPNLYQRSKNADGTELFSRDSSGTHYRFLYNVGTHRISNPNPGQPFNVDSCLYWYDDLGIYFIK